MGKNKAVVLAAIRKFAAKLEESFKLAPKVAELVALLMKKGPTATVSELH